MDALTDLVRVAMATSLSLMTPLLVAGLMVGMVAGLIQALTNVQDQAISLVPRILVMFLTMMVCLPWLIGRIVEYSSGIFSHSPFTSGG